MSDLQIDPIGSRDAKIAELEAALREFACTGTDDPCGCYRLLSQEKAEIERLHAVLENEAIIIRDLRERVKQLGEMADCCTYDTLGAICDNCRCPRHQPQDATAVKRT